MEGQGQRDLRGPPAQLPTAQLRNLRPEIQKLTQSYTPRKWQQWALNSGDQALTTVLSCFKLNAHLLHTHPTQSGKHRTYLQMTTHLGQVYSAARWTIGLFIHGWPIGAEKRKTISQFGFFGVPQAVLLCSSINVHLQGILLSPEPGLALGGLISEAEGCSGFWAYQERSDKQMAAFDPTESHSNSLPQ